MENHSLDIFTITLSVFGEWNINAIAATWNGFTEGHDEDVDNAYPYWSHTRQACVTYLNTGHHTPGWVGGKDRERGDTVTGRSRKKPVYCTWSRKIVRSLKQPFCQLKSQVHADFRYLQHNVKHKHVRQTCTVIVPDMQASHQGKKTAGEEGDWDRTQRCEATVAPNTRWLKPNAAVHPHAIIGVRGHRFSQYITKIHLRERETEKEVEKERQWLSLLVALIYLLFCFSLDLFALYPLGIWPCF